MVVVTFKAKIGPDSYDQIKDGTESALNRHQVGTKLDLSEEQRMVLAVSKGPQPLLALMGQCGRTDRTKFKKQVLNPLLEAGLLIMTIPGKPQSPKQRYRSTEVVMKALVKKKP